MTNNPGKQEKICRFCFCLRKICKFSRLLEHLHFFWNWLSKNSEDVCFLLRSNAVCSMHLRSWAFCWTPCCCSFLGEHMVSQHQPHPLLIKHGSQTPRWPIFMKQDGCAKESTPGGHIFVFFMMMVSQNIHKRGHKKKKTNRKTPLLQS